MGRQAELQQLLEELSNLPVNENEEIDEAFRHFEKGSCLYEVWHWIEEEYDVCLGKIFDNGCKLDQ